MRPEPLLALVAAIVLTLFSGCAGSGTSQPALPSQGIPSLSFQARTDLSTAGTKPGSVAIADFNGDGKLDIAVSNFASNTIAVFLNKGNGTFQNPVLTTVQIPNGLGAMAVGDFNEDGKPDLVVATISGLQYDIVLLGNGDGTFSQQPPIPNSFGFFNARVADLNGDGHLDIVQGANGNVALSLGKGDGTFGAMNFLPTASFPGAYLGIAVADFNNDKKLDLVVCDHGTGQGSTLVYYPGNGDGSFQGPTSMPAGNSFCSSLGAADFNGDGNQDLLIGFDGGLGFTGVAWGSGNGTFQPVSPATSLHRNPPAGGNIVQIADLNADGKPDAVVADYTTGMLSMVLNDAIAADSAGDVYQFSIAPGLSDIAVGDLNGDGLPDVVVSNSITNQISIFLSQKH